MVGELGSVMPHGSLPGGGLWRRARFLPLGLAEVGERLGWAGGYLRLTPYRPDHQEAVLLERGPAPGIHEQGPLPHPPRLPAQVCLP